MTTQEAENLILKHADDFRTLLGAGLSLAVFGDIHLVTEQDNPWLALMASGPDTIEEHIPIMIAIAAFTESWRDRLESEYGVRMVICGPQLFPVRGGQHLLHGADGFSPAITSQGTPRQIGFRMMLHAICATVAALAKEKRAAETPKPSKAAIRAAERWIGMAISDDSSGFVAKLATIIDDEFRKDLT